jgi:hypothetical protein
MVEKLSGLIGANGEQLKSVEKPFLQILPILEHDSYVIGMEALPDQAETAKMSNAVMGALQKTFPQSKFLVICGLQSLNKISMSKEELLAKIAEDKDSDFANLEKIVIDAIKGAQNG